MELPLLSVRGLARSFYGVQALSGADLDVEAGTITGLIGPNGAGKTTLFNCITGLVPPQSGRVTFDGTDLTGWRPEAVTGRGLVRTFQIARGFPRLTVFENLLLYGARQDGEGLGAVFFAPARVRRRETALKERALAIAERLRLKPVIDNPASALSGGQKKLLEIGRALMTDPKLILLDEPIAGVNPTLSRAIGEHLTALKEDGLTFLVIEHDMDIVARLCDTVTVMVEGRRLMSGSFADVQGDPRVQSAYMGGRALAS
ncbi:MAG: ABC transporter ATP-binding protein [Inquilinaceae bacterium]